MKIEDLIAENQVLKETILHLKEQIKTLQKMIFGQKSERFIDDPAQTFLPGLEPKAEQGVPDDIVTVPAHEKRKAKSTPINTISYPEDLPIETVILDLKEEKKVDSSGKSLVKIGEEITKRLAVKPSQFFVKQIIRYKYATSGDPDSGIKTAPLPDSILK